MDEGERPDVEHLAGNVGGATREGDTVLRPAGPWTPAVHALLQHLAARGLPGVPRVLGVEGDTERLSFLPGRSIEPDDEASTDAELAGAVAWLRAFHEAVRDLRPREPLAWRGHEHPVALAEDELICHNDPGSYNWVVDRGAFVGMIDWDMAGPGRPIDDLAFLAWSGVPLHREIPLADAARRIRIVVDAYGGPDAATLLDAVERRMRTASERIAAGQRRGDPGLLNLAAVGEPGRTLERIAAFRARRDDLLAAL